MVRSTAKEQRGRKSASGGKFLVAGDDSEYARSRLAVGRVAGGGARGSTGPIAMAEGGRPHAAPYP